MRYICTNLFEVVLFGEFIGIAFNSTSPGEFPTLIGNSVDHRLAAR